MYYVYKHVESNSVMYVGYGVKDRQYHKNKFRSKEHAEWILSQINNVGNDYSEVIKYFNEEADARYFERLMIKKYQPCFNKFHTKDFKFSDEEIKRRKEFASKQIGGKNPMFGKQGKMLGRTGEKSPLFGRKRPNHSKLMSGKNNPMSKENRERRARNDCK